MTARKKVQLTDELIGQVVKLHAQLVADPTNVDGALIGKLADEFIGVYNDIEEKAMDLGALTDAVESVAYGLERLAEVIKRRDQRIARVAKKATAVKKAATRR